VLRPPLESAQYVSIRYSERLLEAGMADLGLRLTETKQLMAALQDQIVPAQVALVGERCSCQLVVGFGRS
jgi:hypothetical protein